MDSEPIRTEPTTEPVPSAPTDVVRGPSQGPGSPAAGPGGGTSIRGVAIGLAFALTFVVGVGVGRVAPSLFGAATGAPSPTDLPSDAAFALIGEAWQILHEDYVRADELDDTALAYGAIEGLADAVGDPGHTSFLTPEERQERSEELSGSYVGIGVRIDAAEDGRPLIVLVFRGSPAEGAGLRTGEIIVAVDGRETAGADLDEVASWIRGEAGSSVTVRVRDGVDGPERELTIVRADVEVAAVSWALYPGTSTAVLRLEQFSNGSADDLKAALGEIRAAGADRVILDLRGNPGGYVGEAIGVASQFLPTGVVYVERNAEGGETRHEVSPDGAATDLPLVVLVDAGTASSAEIVSGAIQDAERAELIGEKTFGTGTVLGEFPLTDGSALRVGTTEWLTPSGRRIWHQGIEPDVVVERPDEVRPLLPDDFRSLTPAEANARLDPQLERALSVVAQAVAPGAS
jgi:carboxyl-terminal processing protease